jgi:ABC-type Zn2+ transport system substrate-binding protein/surface adhesin
MQAIVAELKAEPPAMLFTEPQLESQLALALAREAGVAAHPVDALGGGPGAESYEELVRGIARALGGALR